MLCYTCTTWNPYRQHHSMLHSLNLIFDKLVENNFRDLHFLNLKSLLTISFYTTLKQPDFLYIYTTWFQRVTSALPEIFADDIIVYHTHTNWFLLHLYNLISGFYTCTTWNLYLCGNVAYYAILALIAFHHIRKTWFQWLAILFVHVSLQILDPSQVKCSML